MYYNNRIKVTNTSIIVDNYKLHESTKLEKPFEIWDPVTHKSTPLGYYYDEPEERLYLPAGIDLWFVRQCLGENYYTRLDPYPYMNINNIYMKYKPRDEEQVKILQFMTGASAEWEDNKYQSQLSVASFTGVGKTYCSVATIAYYKIKSIIITASNSLLKQWNDNILEYTNLRQSDIFRINGSDLCNMILSGNSRKAENASIYLCSHGTLRSYGERYGWDKVGELFKFLGIGLKFFDEAHQNFENMLMIDFFTNVYKTYYVTATPLRSDRKENYVYQTAIKNIPQISLFDENKHPHTHYIAIKWNSNPTARDISNCRSLLYGLDRNKYMEYLTTKPEFYQMMHVAMDLVKKCGGRVLMYIGTNNGIARVYYWICNNYPEFISNIGIFTSIATKEEKAIAKEKKLILTTTKSAGAGEHIEHLKMSMVIAEPFKSQVLARQTLGRTRDNDTMYVEFVDLGFKKLTRYYYAKLNTFNTYAKDVSDVTIDRYEMQKRSENIINKRTHYQQSPISFIDNRFDFDTIVPNFIKKEAPKPNTPYCPIRFINKDNY